MAIDGSGDAWIADVDYSILAKFSSAGTALSTNGYTGGGLSGSAAMAIDGSGDVWTTSAYYNGNYLVPNVTKFTNAGVALSPPPGYTGGGLNQPLAIAIDGAGNAWTANAFAVAGVWSGSVSEFSSAGAALSPSAGYTGANLSYPESIAIDGSGDVWIANYISGVGVSELIGVATPVVTPICAGLPATPTANGSSNLGTRP
jgi:hypothetical protein